LVGPLKISELFPSHPAKRAACRVANCTYRENQPTNEMNLTDYPAPITDAAAETRIVKGKPREIVDAEFARQLEREDSAWKAVAEGLRSAATAAQQRAADDAFDALKSQLEGKP